MKDLCADAIRNVAVVSSTGAGKTSLVEALAFTAGTIPAMGSVLAGTTVSDFEPEEAHRKISLSTSVLHLAWKGARLNLLDTPGALSLFGETQAAFRAVEGVLLVVSPSIGVRSELVRVWKAARDRRLPCLLFVNALDKEGVAFKEMVDACQAALGVPCVPLAVPLGEGDMIGGVADIFRNVIVKSRADSAKVQEGSMPAELAGQVEEGRKRLAEGVAEVDDQLLEAYLSSGELSEGQILEGLRQGIQGGMVLPVLCGSALRNIGTTTLLDAIVSLLPSPSDATASVHSQGIHPSTGEPVTRKPLPTEPLSAFVFKTIIDPFMGRLTYVRVLSGTMVADTGLYNATRQVREKGGHLFSIFGKKYSPVPTAVAGEIVAIGKLKDTQTGDTLCDEQAPVKFPALHLARPVLSFALEPKSKADVEKVSLGLHKLIEEDPSFEFLRNQETKEMVLSGMGQLHIDVALEKLRRKYGVEVTLHTPKVPYKETVRTVAQAQGKYKKQTGGHGQYGDCWLELAPLARGKGFEFENRIVGGAIPRNFIPAVEKGVVEAMHEGILAGFPVVDLKVSVYDGSYHVVDSSEMSFKIAASMGFKKAMETAHPVLLEPLMTVDVEAPQEHIGAVIGDLNGRRGRIVNVAASANAEIIRAIVPLAEMLKYAPTLNSITAGRGTYVMEFAQYEEVPRELATKIIEEHKAARMAVAAH